MIVADIKETSNETLLDYLANAKATTLCSGHSKGETTKLSCVSTLVSLSRVG